MAQLKNTIILGDLSVTGAAHLAKTYTNILMTPTSNGGTTYGPGTNGQVLTSNGTTTYWGNSLNATINSGSANRMAYYSTATAISAANIISDGNYLSNISYLTVNAQHQTTYRLSVNGVTNSLAYTLNGATSAGTNYITGSAGRIFFGGNFHIDSLGTNKTYINYYTANDVLLVCGSSQGKVGIGTATPSYKLHVNGNTGINGNLDFLTIGHISWVDGTYRQRLYITDDSTTDTAVFTFQQSENSGSSYNDLLTIRDNGKLILTTNTGGIYQLITSATNKPLLQVSNKNFDCSILRIDGNNRTSHVETKSYGFDLKYIGTGGGEGNSLRLIADNSDGADVTAFEISNNGKFGIGANFNTNYRLYINGNTLHNGVIYLANGTTYYIDNNADAKLRYLALGGLTPTSSYQLYVNGTSWIKGTLWVRHTYPEANNTYDLGSTSYKWRNLYVNTIYSGSYYAAEGSYSSSDITTAGAGWYTVATYNSGSSNATTRGSIEFYIDSTGGSMSPSMCKIHLDLTWSIGQISYADFTGSTYLVGGVRLTYVNASTTYIEVYFNRAAASGARLIVPYNSPYRNVNQSYTWAASGALTATASDRTIGTTFYHYQNGYSTQNLSPTTDLTYYLGSTTRRYKNIYSEALDLLCPSSNPSTSAGARIRFSYTDSSYPNGAQSMYIGYTPNDSYRAPMGLKIWGEDAAAWVELDSKRWITNPTRQSGALIFTPKSHTELTNNTYYYRPWLSGSEGIASAGYNNAWTAGLFAIGPSTSNTDRGVDNVGFYLGTAWDDNATTDKVWRFSRGGNLFAPRGIYGIHIKTHASNSHYIMSPGGGSYATNTSTVTGAIKITLPVSWTSCMMRFAVDIYNYSTGELASYYIGGYNYSSSSAWINTSAYSVGIGGISNRTVRFGHDGSKCCVTIGETNSTWSYPQIVVRDVYLGFIDQAINTWSMDWSVSFVTTLPTTSGTAFTNTNKVQNGTANRLAYYINTYSLGQHSNLITDTQITYGSRTITPVLRVNNRLYVDNAIESGEYFLVNRSGAGAYYYLRSNNVDYGLFWVNKAGVKPTATTTDGTTTYSGAVIGETILRLGNNKVGANSASGVADNARGYLQIYCDGSSYSQTTSYGSWLYPETGLAIPVNKIGIMFRPDSSSYYTHFSYQTAGNEALVMATQDTVTSFIFINGESYANDTNNSRWRSLVPGLQIKQNCVRIGALWDSGTNADYKLRVDGTTYFKGDSIFAPTADATLKIYDVTNTTYGTETIAIQSCFDNQDPESSGYVTSYQNRCNLLLQPRGGQVYIGNNLTSVGETRIKLNVNGAISAQTQFVGNDKYFFHDVAKYIAQGSSTGTICITLPFTYANQYDMPVLRIIIYEYDSNSTSQILVGGHNWTSGKFHNANYTVLGHYNKGVRLGNNGTKHCILLGTTTTTWNYVGVYIDTVVSQYSAMRDRWLDAVTITKITNETGYTVENATLSNFHTSKLEATWLRVVNDSSDNTDDALVYFRNYSSSDWALKIAKSTYNYGIYIEGTGTELLRVGTNSTLRVFESTTSGSGSVRLNGILYFANGTTYFINNSAVGYLNDLRVDNTRLVDNWLGFYSAVNAGGNRLGYIQTDNSYMYFRKEQTNNGFNFNGNLVPSSRRAANVGTTALEWAAVYATNHTLYRDGAWYGDFHISTVGTANSGDNNQTQGTAGVVYVRIGNNVARPAAGTAGGANNAYGILRIYNIDTSCGDILANRWSSYGALCLDQARGGYRGLLVYPSSTGLTIMDNGTDRGLYSQGKMWIIYHNASSNRVGIGGSAVSGGLPIQLNGNTYLAGRLEVRPGSNAPPIGIYTSAGTWSYIRLHNGSNLWDIATNSNAAGSAVANSLGFRYNGGNPSTSAGVWITPSQVLYGACWNDYAEYRVSSINEPGRVVKESPTGELIITTARLERGCEIISDTFGFAIGIDEDDRANAPTAAAGRVLAYTDKPRETFELGMPVCSGPNGTVSQMTEEEARMYPWCIIGTVSEIPNYEEWGTGKVKVNGRIWIRIR